MNTPPDKPSDRVVLPTIETPTLTKAELDKMESMMRVTLTTALDWFKEEKAALIKHLVDGGTYERYFVVLNDPVREAIAVRLISVALKDQVPAGASASAPVEEKKGGFFSKLFGKR